MNRLQREKQELVIRCLCEGMGIRPTERATGVARNTVMRLQVSAGEACQRLHDQLVWGLTSDVIEVDELWSFVSCKERRIPEGVPRETIGEQWVWVALDRNTKFVISWRTGKRSIILAQELLDDVRLRLKSDRPQICSDGWEGYPEAVEEIFGIDVDYGMIVKELKGGKWDDSERRYAPTRVKSAKRRAVVGYPADIGTSYVERQNHTMRMHTRRLTRLVNGFSKRLRNHKAAIALYFAYYNFVKIHRSLKMTPAMAAGVVDRLWDLEDLLSAADRAIQKPLAA